jgi:hypothetical protein
MDDHKSEEESDREKSDSTETEVAPDIPEVQLIPSSEWNWEMSHDERLTQCELLEEKFWSLVRILIYNIKFLSLINFLTI